MKKALRILTAMVLCLALAACGSPAAETTAKKETTKETEKAESAAETKETAGETKSTAGEDLSELKVALCLTGPINDGAWNTSAYNGLVQAQEKYGFQMSYMENLAVVDQEAALADYAEQGFDLVIGHSFQFGDPALAVSERYPDTKFVVIEGSAAADNVASYNLKSQENAYLLGVLAAHLTESDKVGIISTIEGPSLIKIIEGYRMGAKSVNPDIEVQHAFTGSFTDVAKAKEAAMAMIDDGVDAIANCANQGGTGVIKAGVEKDIMLFGTTVDQYDLAPDNMVTSSLTDVTGLLVVAIESVIEGKFQGGIHELGYMDNLATLAPYHNFEDVISEEVKEEIVQLQKEMADGTLDIPRIEELQSN